MFVFIIPQNLYTVYQYCTVQYSTKWCYTTVQYSTSTYGIFPHPILPDRMREKNQEKNDEEYEENERENDGENYMDIFKTFKITKR